jgi:uncharacterized protein with PIN domain
MVRVHTTLSVEQELLERVKETSMNMSDILNTALRDRLGIKVVEIPEGNKCEYCGREMRQATKDDMNGLYWFFPDEKWICPLCDKMKSRAIINSEF